MNRRETEFKPLMDGHLECIEVQDEQVPEFRAIMSGMADQLVRHSDIALSAWSGAGVCLGAGGLCPITQYRAFAWLLLSKHAGPHMLPVVRKLRRVVKASRFARVEIQVAEGFLPAKHLAVLLGARCETSTPLRYFGADGRDERLYAWIRDEHED